MRPLQYKLNSEGISLRLVKSPEAPKMTIEVGNPLSFATITYQLLHA
jgi:hypothetical protein